MANNLAIVKDVIYNNNCKYKYSPKGDVYMPSILKPNTPKYQSNGRLRISFIAILAVILAFAVLAIFVLPAMAPEVDNQVPHVTSIVLEDNTISVNAKLNNVIATVTYSDGTAKQIALSEMYLVGLDYFVEGENNVSINFGGFEQQIVIKVVKTECILDYKASVGGRIEGDIYQTVPSGGNASTVVAIPEVGYRFVRWSDGNPNAIRMDKKVSLTREITASFEKIKYLVVFYYPDNTTAREEYVSYGEAATKVPRPDEQEMKKYGYKFMGWSEDYTSITKDTLIYPILEKNATDVFVDPTLGVEGLPLGTFKDLQAFYEKDLAAVIRTEANPGRRFEGWKIKQYDNTWKTITREAGETSVAVASQYEYMTFKASRTGNSTEYTLTFTPGIATDIFIKAEYVYEESEISFVSMQGKAKDTILLKVEQEIGDYNLLPPSALSGFEFLYWYVKNAPLDSNGRPVAVLPTDKFSRPTELIALWERKTYEVYFYLGSNEDANFKKLPGYDAEKQALVLEVLYQDTLESALNNVKFPEAKPFRSLYAFRGWYLGTSSNPEENVIIDKTYQIVNQETHIYPLFRAKQRQLSLSFVGSGEVRLGLKDATSSPIDSQNVFLNADKDYTITFIPASGYSMTNLVIKIDNIIVHTDNGLHRSYTYNVLALKKIADLSAEEFDTPITNVDITCDFVLAQYNMTLTNGSEGYTGTIAYYDTLADGTSSYKESKDASLSLKIMHNMSKQIYIYSDNANGYIIKSIQVIIGGKDQFLTDIPTNATSYTVLLERLQSDVSLIVTYEELKFSVTIPPETEDQNGTIQALNYKPEYSKEDKPAFKVAANEGYIIKFLKINGVEIDPYGGSELFMVTNQKVNGVDIISNTRASADNIKDYRLTYYILTIKSFTDDLNLLVEFEPIKYTVRVSTEGIGNVDKSYLILDYDSNTRITASTTEGYYVQTVSINGVTSTYEKVLSQASCEINNIKKDYEIKFVFQKRTKAITFSGKNVDIVYNNDKGDPTEEKLDGAEITYHKELNANLKYDIRSRDGYYISKVTVDGVSRELVNNALSYTLRLDNIVSDIFIVIEVADLNYNFGISSVNGADTKITGVMEQIGYNGSLSIKIDPKGGKRVNKFVVNQTEISFGINDFGGVTLIIDGKEKNFDDANDVSIEFQKQIIKIFKDNYTGIIELDFSGVKTANEILVFFENLVPESAGEITFSYNDSYADVKAYYASDVLYNNPITNVNAEDDIVIRVVEKNPSYTLKYLVVNGKIVSLTDGIYRYTVPNTKQTVEAIFQVKLYKLTFKVDGFGNLTSLSNVFTYQQESGVNIKVLPEVGNELYSFTYKKNGSVTTVDTKNIISGNYLIAGGILDNDIEVTATFRPQNFLLTLNIEGNGAVTDFSSGESHAVNYGGEYSLVINANKNHYIDSITINGVIYDMQRLLDRSIDPNIQKIITGTLKIEIKGETSVTIKFSPNVYRVILADGDNGTSLVYLDGTTPSDGQNLSLSAGDSLSLSMKADEGYHIQELIINGQIIDGWKLDNDNPNNNKDYTYIIEDISNNINVRVSYAINAYSAKIVENNESPNFQKIDNSSSTFGTVRIYGKTLNSDNIYRGIVHGTDIRIVVAPNIARGYHISSFKITYVDSSKEGADSTITLDLTSTIGLKGGEYVFRNVKCDIQSIEAIFTRDLFEYKGNIMVDSKNSLFGNTGSLVYKFQNPYDLTAEVQIINDKYEFGLEYTIEANPGIGYNRSQFMVANSDSSIGEDRNNQVRGNTFRGTMMSNMFLTAYYTINEYKITTNVVGISGGLVEIKDTLGNNLVLNGNSEMIVTHDTEIGIHITPEYITKGYYIYSFSINGKLQTIVDIDNLNVLLSKIYLNTEIKVEFKIHTYAINVAEIQGGFYTVSSREVLWGGETSISLTVSPGHTLAYVLVNDIYYNSDVFVNGKYTITNIKENQNITLQVNRQDFKVNLNPLSNINGDTFIIVDKNGIELRPNQNSINIRYNDEIMFYFKPAEGFEVGAISMTMKDLSGSTINLISSVNDLQFAEINDNADFRIFFAKITGDVNLSIIYKVKSYFVEYQIPNNIDRTQLIGNIKNHHETNQTIILTAAYGYHIVDKIITINGKDYVANYSINSNNRYVYTLTIDINKSLLNSYKQINISVKSGQNSFGVVVYVNGINQAADNKDETLNVQIDNNRFQFAQNASVVQNRKLGWSITELKINTEANSLLFSYPKNSNELTSNIISFYINGVIIDSLDYHNEVNNQLFFYYLTEIDRHTSIVNTYLKETGRNTDSKDDNKFSVSASYTEPSEGGNSIQGKYKYGTDARFMFTLRDEDNYRFGGFMEKRGNIWVAVVDGVNGIRLTNSGYTLDYNVNGNREFIAVVYRQYIVTVHIYPEHKYISGYYNPTNFNMVYQTYTRLEAKSINLSINDSSVIGETVLTNLNQDDFTRNAIYKYKVDCDSKLYLKGTDMMTSSNQSTIYYYMVNGEVIESSPNLSINKDGVLIKDAKDVAIFFNNNTLISMEVETIGGLSSSEGGTIAYTVNGGSKNLVSNSLEARGKDTVRITVVPNQDKNINFKVEGIYKRETLGTDPLTKRLIFTNNWIKVDNNNLPIYSTYLDDGKKVVLEMLVTENAIYKVKFVKQITVTSKVSYVTDESNSNGASTGDTMFGSESSANGVYEYYDASNPKIDRSMLHYEINTLKMADKFDQKWQFVGFFVNTYNSFRELQNAYPVNVTADGSKYKVDFTLYQYNSDRRDGVNLSNIYSLEIVAKFVPVYNIVVENVYDFDEKGGKPKEFDQGNVLFSTVPYVREAPQYYSSSNTVSKDSNRAIQILGKINNPRMESSYDAWLDNTLTLRYDIQVGFQFLGWQYFDPNQSMFVNIPYKDGSSSINTVTSLTFTFPLRVLFNQNTPSKANIFGFDENGQPTDEVKEILAIRLRANIQKIETMEIEKENYYDSKDIISYDHPDDNKPAIVGSGLNMGSYNYDRIIELEPNAKLGYRFLGWFVDTDDGIVQITKSFGTISEGKSFELIDKQNGVEVNRLKVKMDNSYIVIARYVKVWTLIVQSYNVSGTALYDSAPYLEYYGESSTVIQGDKNQYYRRRAIDVTLDAGTTVKFGLTSDGTTTFNNEGRINDIYFKTSLIDQSLNDLWLGSYEAQNSTTPKVGEGIIPANVVYYLKADGQKTLQIQYRTLGSVTIKNVMKDSALHFGNANNGGMSFLEAIRNENPNAQQSNFVIDRTSNNQDTYIGLDVNPLEGEFTIDNIPMLNNYSSSIGNRLVGMQSDKSIRPPNTANGYIEFPLNFNGNEVATKNQIFYYYNDGSNSGVSAMDKPFGDGVGTKELPYIIKNIHNLRSIDLLYEGNGQNVANMYFSIVNNIDIGTQILKPMCSNGDGFNGILYGSSSVMVSLTNLSMQAYDKDNIGLFAKTNNATISNLIIGGRDTLVVGKNNVGYLVGLAMSTTLSNITTPSTIGDNGYIEGEKNVGYLVGATVGEASGMFSNIMLGDFTLMGRESSLNIGSEAVGGIVGKLAGNTSIAKASVKNIYVNAKKYVGGLVGWATDSKSLPAIQNSGVETAKIGEIGALNKIVGGIVGKNDVNNIISNAYTAGEIMMSSDNKTVPVSNNAETLGVGGIVGYNAGELIDCEIGKKLVLSTTVTGTATDSSGVTIASADSTSINVTGSIAGGIVGTNLGKITRSKTNNATIYITLDGENQGYYGGHVGYNKEGIIDSAVSIKAYSNAGWNFDQATLALSQFFEVAYQFDLTDNKLTSISNVKSQGGFIAVGGIVGYNNGVVTNSQFSAKAMFARYAGDTLRHTSKMGGIVGINHGSIRQSGIERAFVGMYNYIWADAPQTLESLHRIGGIAGETMEESFTDVYVRNSDLKLLRIAKGAYYVDWTIVLGSPWSNSSGYNEVTLNSRIYTYGDGYTSGGSKSDVRTLIETFTTKTPASKELYTTYQFMFGERYKYDNAYRKVTGQSSVMDQ